MHHHHHHHQTRNWEGHPGGMGPGMGGGRGRRGGPPPWLAAVFGEEGPKGPRARRGDVRIATLDVLGSGPLNGYQVIQQITERTEGMWKPSPGSVYPTMQQLEDEGLIEPESAGSKSMRLTEAGSRYVEENAAEFAAVWRPFANDAGKDGKATFGPEIGKLMHAFGQIMAVGTDEQKERALAALVETRKKLYGLLAEE